MSKKLKFAIIPVAGYGTRLLPASKSIPKEMMPIFDRPAIDHVASEAFKAGIEHIIFITNRKKSSIEDYFDHAYELEEELKQKNKQDLLALCTASKPQAGSISFIRQQKAAGLGNAIFCARQIIGDHDFCVLLPDVILQKPNDNFKKMVNHYNNTGEFLIMVDKQPDEKLHQYGIIEQKNTGDDLLQITNMIEKPQSGHAPSNYAITGRYILPNSVFSHLTNAKAGSGGEIQLTDALIKALDVNIFRAFPLLGQAYDCGSKEGYLQAFINFTLEQNSDYATLITQILQEHKISRI